MAFEHLCSIKQNDKYACDIKNMNNKNLIKCRNDILSFGIFIKYKDKYNITIKDETYKNKSVIKLIQKLNTEKQQTYCTKCNNKYMICISHDCSHLDCTNCYVNLVLKFSEYDRSKYQYNYYAGICTKCISNIISDNFTIENENKNIQEKIELPPVYAKT